MTSSFEYDVAISFAGEQREYARAVAECLIQHGCKIFFDEYQQAALWGSNLQEHLADIYENKARYCLMLVSKEYADKVWTTHERRSAQARALKQKESYILPVVFDTTRVPGLSDTVGYLEAHKFSPSHICTLLLEKANVRPIHHIETEHLKHSRLSRVAPKTFISRTRVIVAVIAVALVLISIWLYSLTQFDGFISFDVWHDLQRNPEYRNWVYLGNDNATNAHREMAVVIFGGKRFKVDDINIESVRASAENGVGATAIRYYLQPGYDENRDGYDDLKLDFDVVAMQKVGDLSVSSKSLRVWGGMKNTKQRFEGIQKINVVP